MSAFKELRYFKEIILDELNKYSSISDESLKEIYLRNIASRLYYTAMHFCIEKYNIEIDSNERTHEQVLRNIPQKGIKQRLKSLKAIRENADYKTNTFNFPLTSGGRSGILLSKIEHIKDTLKFFENLQV